MKLCEEKNINVLFWINSTVCEEQNLDPMSSGNAEGINTKRAVNIYQI